MSAAGEQGPPSFFRPRCSAALEPPRGKSSRANTLQFHFSESAKPKVFSLLTASRGFSGPRDRSRPSELLGFCNAQQHWEVCPRGRPRPRDVYLICTTLCVGTVAWILNLTVGGELLALCHQMLLSSTSAVLEYERVRVRPLTSIYWLISTRWFHSAENR